jgi:hypothetical protein
LLQADRAAILLSLHDILNINIEMDTEKGSQQKKLKKENSTAISTAWKLIFRYVDVKDLVTLCLVQKSFWEAIRTDEDIWKHVFISEYGPCENLCKRDSWKSKALRRRFFERKNFLKEVQFVSK